MRASSYCHSPGRFCTREMRPTPIAPMLMRVLGAICPSTLDGTIVGKPAAAATPAAVFTKLRREIRFVLIFIAFLLPRTRVSYPSIT
jgi:hypothetical protein